MNKNIGLLLIGGLVLALASTASANSTGGLCGTVGSSGGSTSFTSVGTSPLATWGTAMDNSGGSPNAQPTAGNSGTITCNAFTVPAGETLVGITVSVTDDAQSALNLNSQISWSWTYSGQLLTPVPAGTNHESGIVEGDNFGFNQDCSGTGTLVCNTAENFTPVGTYANGATTGIFSFTVAAYPTGPGSPPEGLGPSGSVSAAGFFAAGGGGPIQSVSGRGQNRRDRTDRRHRPRSCRLLRKVWEREASRASELRRLPFIRLRQSKRRDASFQRRRFR